MRLQFPCQSAIWVQSGQLFSRPPRALPVQLRSSSSTQLRSATPQLLNSSAPDVGQPSRGPAAGLLFAASGAHLARSCGGWRRLMSSGGQEGSSSKPEREEYQYDLCVIGAGPGGWAGAVRGWDLGKKVCLIEHRGGLGGASVWGGGLGGKVLLEFGKGLRFAEPYLKDKLPDSKWVWDEVRKRVRAAMLERATALDRQLIALGQTKKFNRPQLKRAKRSGTIERWKGWARFESPHTLLVGDDLRIQAEHFLVCTGSKTKPLAKFPTDGKYIINPEHFVRQDELPRSAVVAGPGIVGCEMANVLRTVGRGDNDVHLINDKPRLYPMEDEDFSDWVEYCLEFEGVKIHHNSRLEYAKVWEDKGQVECRVVTQRMMPPQEPGMAPMRSQSSKTFWVDKLILCNSRKPNTDSLDLDVAGVDTDLEGGILVDNCNKSVSAPHIVAAGDALGRGGLTTVAEDEARFAVEMLYDQDIATKPAYDSVSSVLHLKMPISCVGMCEEEAARRGIPYVVARIDLDNTAYGLIRKHSTIPSETAEAAPSDSEAEGALPLEFDPFRKQHNTPLGFVKIVVQNDESQRLLGMRSAGEGAVGVTQAAAVMIRSKAHVRELALAPLPHPSMTEAVQECVRQVLGISIYKLHAFSELEGYVKNVNPVEATSEAGDERSTAADEEQDDFQAGGTRFLVPTYMD